MKSPLFLLVLFFQFGAQAFGFIPPVSQALRDVFQGRKSGPAEAVLRHRIRVADETFEIEEHLGGERGKGYSTFRVNNGPSLAALWERGRYVFGGEKQYSSRSTLFTKYFFADSGEEFRDALLGEGFLRREQLLQYKQGFNPTGEPNAWDVKGNYLSHPDISLTRMPGGIAISVVGTNDSGRKRTVAFDQRLNGVRRLEWVDGGEVIDWTFDQFSVPEKGPKLPRKLSFHRSATEVIASEVIGFHALRDKQWKDNLKSVRSRMQGVAVSGNLDEALRILLSYR